MRRWHPASSLALLALLALLQLACVDTSVPDLNGDFGLSRTPGPFCTPDALDVFPPEELRLHIIDVGQGDAIWVQTPYYESQLLESRNILIDAGPSGNVPGTSPGGDIVVQYMIGHGMLVGDALHAFVLTHAHEDHYGGGSTVAEAFSIERYVDPGFTADSSGFIATRADAEADVRNVNGKISVPAIDQLVPRRFTRTDLFGEYVDATLLWAAAVPPSGNASSPSGTDINNTSVAFSLRWGQNQVLLLADLEAEVEASLIAAHDAGEISLVSQVLKVAHHGSSSSSSLGFLSRVFPAKQDQNWAVISSGVRTFSGTTLPTEQTLGFLKQVLEPNHVLSTENLDLPNPELGVAGKPSGTEHGDDPILVRLMADGRVEVCYGL